MKWLKSTAVFLTGAFLGAFMYVTIIAAKTFDVETKFGKVTCFKLD